MRARVFGVAIAAIAIGGLVTGQSNRINPPIDLLKAHKPLFGLYAPSNPRGGGGGRPGGAGGGAGRTGAAGGGTAGVVGGVSGAVTTPPPPPPPATPPVVKTTVELAKDALTHTPSDYVFSGSMEGGLDRANAAGATAFSQFAEFVAALTEAGPPALRRQHPLAVKTPEIAADPVKAIDNISRQLNLGVSTIVFVGVESADEVKKGLAAMRFKSKGGTRPDGVGTAPAYWGLSEADYRKKADLWPLNPDGELLNWTIVESKEGLAHVREIAAVKGISVLFPGAGTLGGVFSTTNAEGRRVRDDVAWEAAIQQVLAACKEFNVPCGYPATENDIEMRMKQGFSVFIINWGEAGFRAVDIGRRIAGRTDGK